MTSLAFDLLALLVGFLMLAKGADGLVNGGATLARRWGVSPLVVGLTVVAWGTSMPEVVVSAIAASRGESGASLGNVLGSNVANIGLVLGSSALILPMVLRDRVRPREAVWLLGSLLVLWGACIDGVVTRPEAGAMLALFALYNWLLLRRRSSRRSLAASEEAQEHESRRPWLAVLLGSAAIAFGAHFIMTGALSIADRAGLSGTVVGLTILALGTSLPELAAGIGSARRGHSELSFGNVVGSNVFNTLAVVAIAALVRPFGGVEDEVEMNLAISRDIPINFGFAAGLIVLPFLAVGSFTRVKAGLLLGGYLTYMVVVVVAGGG